MSRNSWPALEFGAAWIKFKIEISMPLNFAGLFLTFVGLFYHDVLIFESDCFAERSSLVFDNL